MTTISLEMLTQAVPDLVSMLSITFKRTDNQPKHFL